MRAKLIVFVVCLVVATSAFAGVKSEIVTNAPPALSASMTLAGSTDSCAIWQVTGKVRPEFRGVGASVHLVCTQYNALINGTGQSLVYPSGTNDDPLGSSGNVDACGNFNFRATYCSITNTPQLDPSFVCNFVVHVDSPQSPQSCNEPNGTTGGPDPNGSAPCSGGFCPSTAK